jgi:hypothetical protein
MSLRDSEHDGPLIDEFGHKRREEIQWHGSAVEVTARLIPRFLWTTASIDVFIDGECVLETGGQLKITGSSSAEFFHGGRVHQVELSWGRGSLEGFPYQLSIDGSKVAVSRVLVQNRDHIVLALVIPVALMLILMALLG